MIVTKNLLLTMMCQLTVKSNNYAQLQFYPKQLDFQ